MELFFSYSTLAILLASAVFLVSFLKPKLGFKQLQLPPGPPTIPLLTSILWLLKPHGQLLPTVRALHAKHGPIVTLHLGSRPSIFISDRSIAHYALVQAGPLFSSRPPALPTNQVFSSNQHTINFARYGPTWRLLRRNLTSGVLHSSNLKSFCPARKSILLDLVARLEVENVSGVVDVYPHLKRTIISVIVYMCFGDKLSDQELELYETVQRQEFLSVAQFSILNFFPKFGKRLFRARWEKLLEYRRLQERMLIPLIRARKERFAAEKFEADDQKEDAGSSFCYVDTLINLELPEEENHRLVTESEMVSLCSELLNGGSDTTATSLLWIMANVVKYQHIQDRIVEEISDVLELKEDNNNVVIQEGDLQKLVYLKAVVLEGLRLHPPGHYLLPHAVTEDAELNGYLVPKNGTVIFGVADIHRDPSLWEDPMAFKPERFLAGRGGGEMVDLTGRREIKLLPFGAGRRMCPAYSLAILHLEYFVANLVWRFKWTAADGHEVDLTEIQDFTVIMKYPLKAKLSPRF